MIIARRMVMERISNPMQTTWISRRDPIVEYRYAEMNSPNPILISAWTCSLSSRLARRWRSVPAFDLKGDRASPVMGSQPPGGASRGVCKCRNDFPRYLDLAAE